MKELVLITVAIFFINKANSQISNIEVRNGKKADQIHEVLLNLQKKGMSGSIIIESKGEIILKGGYGYANLKKKIPFTSKTISTIGSITKPLTALAIVKLNNQGFLSFEDKISKYITNLEPELQNITIEQLLLHQSGLESILTLNDFNVISKESFLKKLNNKPLKFKPGSQVSYSNIGYSVLAYIIEEITGSKYESYLQKTFFQPLKMINTGYEFYNWGEDQTALGYKGKKPWGNVYNKIKVMDGNYWNLIGNGGIHMNINDIYKWYLAMKNDKEISENIFPTLIKPYVKCGPKSITCYQGYAWVVLYRNQGKDIVAITHSGGNDILYADFWWYPKEEIFVAMLTNNKKFPAEDVLVDIRKSLRK